MIDEKKLIEEFREKVKGYDKDCGYWSKRGEHGNELLCAGKCSGIVQAIKIAENQPKVGEWIPCSERLPEKHVDVLVDFGDENPIIAWYSHVNDTWKNSSTDYVINVDVIAWMSLPEPYKQVEE